MFSSTIVGVLVISVASGFKSCEDCTNLRECPQGMQERNEEKLKDAQCGFDGINFKVCCSDFYTDEIENHRNKHLLTDECGYTESEGHLRMFGGEEANLYEFPWLVLISKTIPGNKRSIFFCSGTLINSRYVLTAAHGIKDNNIDFVRVGEYDISKEIDCQGRGKWRVCESRIQDIAVSHMIAHPKYLIFPVVINDIGLLRLLKPVDFSARNTGAICLPIYKNLRERDLSGEIGTVAGWGRTEKRQSSDILLKVQIPIHSIETCKASFQGYKKIINAELMDLRFKNSICAGERGFDSCQGDSGGPLMLESEYNDTYKIVQYAIVSHGIGCGDGIPAIYTDVRKFLKWILDTIKP